MTQDPQHAPWDRPDGPDRREEPGGSAEQRPAEQQWSSQQRSWTEQQPVEPSAGASGPPSYGPPSSAPPSEQPSEQPSYGPPSSGQPTYGQPSYGGYAGGPPQPPAGYAQQPPGYGYGGVPAGQAPPAPVSTIVLLVLSGIGFLVTVSALVGLVYAAPAVLSIVALTRNRTDPASARRLTKTGWIIFTVATALAVLLVVALVGLFAAGIFGGFSEGGGSYGSSV